MSQIEKIVKKFYKGQQLDLLEELILDDEEIKSFTTEDKKYLEKFTSLELLSLANCKMDSLNNLPQINSIIEIDLSDNQINGAELSKLNIYPNLFKLGLIKNKITDISELKQLSNCKNLEILDLDENEVEKNANFRQEAFNVIPSLKYLDGTDREGKQMPDDYGAMGEGDEEGDEEGDDEEDDYDDGEDYDEDVDEDGEEDDEEDEDDDEDEDQ